MTEHKDRRAMKKEAPMNAQSIIALGFLAIILIVAALLMLPVSSASGTMTDPLTALFTATSAVCVTGLVVVDTATHWSLFGKLVLITGIQIGGLGVMTVMALVSMLLGQRIGLRQRTLLQESVASLHIGGIVRLVRRAMIGTALVEGLGAALLAFRFVPALGWPRGLAYSVFHSISAFCNAGFDLMGTISGPYSSLESFVSDPLVNLTVMALILVGGIGFFVWDDLVQSRLHWKRMQLHTRLVLLLTVLLTLVPAILFYAFERTNAMAELDAGGRVLASLFSAVTPRTAGFDTIATAELSDASALLTLLLMLTGGNPGSTAGGAKTTTMLLVVLLAVSMLRREEDVHILGRRIDAGLMRRACSIVVIYVSLALVSTLVICALQPELPLRDVLLEVFSAVDTVGMTTGITRQLAALPQLIIIALMYAGRLGSLTFAILIAHRRTPAPVQYPAGQLLIG